MPTSGEDSQQVEMSGSNGGGPASVITIESFAEVAAAVRGAFLAVGNFDGVHRGHARLIARLRQKAEAAGAPAVVLTFDPPPVAVLRPEAVPPPLTWIDRKVELLGQAGANEVGIFRTGPWLLGLTAREFFERVVLGQFGARGMVEGPTFGFGRDRGGDARLLASWFAEAGLDFEIAEPTEVDGRIVSSSRIRQALAEGRVDEAATLLGRPHRLRGRVVRAPAEAPAWASRPPISTAATPNSPPTVCTPLTPGSTEKAPTPPPSTSDRTPPSASNPARSKPTSSATRATSTVWPWRSTSSSICAPHASSTASTTS